MLPLAFPPTVPSQSSSYAAGFSNRVATLATVFLSAIFAIILWWKRLGARISEPEEQAPMPRRWLGWASLAAVVFTTLLGWRVVQSGLYYCDASYFMTQLQWKMHFHGTMYRDFDFAYGPLLLYWPEAFVRALGHFGMQPMASYMVSLAVMQVVGIGIVFYVIQTLPLTVRLKAYALAGMTLRNSYPAARSQLHAGPLRPALCGAALDSRLPGRLDAECSLLPGGSTDAWSLPRTRRGVRRRRRGLWPLSRRHNRQFQWLAVAVAPLLSFAVSASLLGRGYFETMMRFAGGAFASVVDPRLHTEIFLIAAVALTPFAMAGYIRRHGPNAGPLVGMYIAALGMLPAGLGRSDELHTFFAGVGVLLISLVGISAYRSSGRRSGSASSSPPVCSAPRARIPLPSARTAGHHRPYPARWLRYAHLEAMTRGQKIALPLSSPSASSTN